MQQIVNFLIKYKNTLLFLLLLLIALVFTIQSHSYHKSKFISSTNFISGTVLGWGNSVKTYFNLGEYNQRLVEENKLLRAKLIQYQSEENDTVFTDSLQFDKPFTFIPARVIKNQYANLDNYLLINKGKKDSVDTELGVISSKGIVGVVEESTNNFSRVISILNTKLSVSAQLIHTDHFGSLSWDGKDPNIIQLDEVPRLAPVAEGDTITTDGRSYIFPKGIPVGVVNKFNLDQSESYYEIEVRLFNDMTNLGHVYIIENNQKEELKALETDE